MTLTHYLQDKNYTPDTIRGYVRSVNKLNAWLSTENISVQHMRYADLLAYVKHCSQGGMNKRYLMMHLTGLRHYFNFLVKTKTLKENIAAHFFIKGYTRRLPHDLLNEEELEAIYASYTVKGLIGKRNKTILGLVIYQGLGSAEIAALETGHLDLAARKLYVPAMKRSNSRTFELKQEQVSGLQHYLNSTRKLILELSGKESEKVFVSTGSGTRTGNIIEKLMKHLRKTHPGLGTVQQLRNSVIGLWVKNYNLREAQYRAGHRYVSSTERYQHTNIEDLKKDIREYHPFNR